MMHGQQNVKFCRSFLLFRTRMFILTALTLCVVFFDLSTWAPQLGNKQQDWEGGVRHRERQKKGIYFSPHAVDVPMHRPVSLPKI